MFGDNEILVADANFLGMRKTSFNEIFDSGKYDTLRLITYSATFDQIYEVAKRFKRTDVIFGSGDVLNGTIAALVHAQTCTVDLVKKSARFNDLVQMGKDGKIGLFLLKEKVSHEKMYILSGPTETLVVIGSANFTQRAFGGNQREFSIAFANDTNAFETMVKYFEESKAKSSIELPLPTLNVNDKKVQDKEVPILALIEKEKIITVEVPVGDFDFVQTVKDFEPDRRIQLEEEMPITKIKNGVISWSYDKVFGALARISVKEEEEERRRKEFPQLVIDAEKGDVSLNGMSLTERSEREFGGKSVKTDLENLCKYMDSFLDFKKGGEEARDIVWKLVCYSFTSPYMARLRKLAEKYKYSLHCFPMYGMIYGEASTTKTSMTKIVRALMCGKVDEGFSFYDSPMFTKTLLLQGAKARQTGLPIFIQDLTKDQWDSHAGNILKYDRYESRQKFDPPLVIITSNDVTALKKEFSKRCLCFNPKTVVTTRDLILGSKKFNDFCDSFSPQLFLEYVRRMNVKVVEMEEELKNSDEKYTPDVIKVSSIVLREICEEMLGYIPDYMYEVDFVRDLYSEEVVGSRKIHELKQHWLASPDSFVFRKDGRVFVDMGETYIASRAKRELPVKLCLEQIGRNLICDEVELDKIGIRRKTMMSKIKNLFAS